MYEGFSREERLIGKENLEKLTKAKVAVFGIGGVGSFVVEGLARAGIGKFLLVCLLYTSDAATILRV